MKRIGSNLVNNGTGVKLYWEAADCAKTYNIYRSTNNSEYVLISNSKTLGFTDQNLEKGTNYSYSVSGVSNMGEGPKRNSQSWLTAPIAPTIILTPSNSADSFNLKWNKVDTATNYLIYRLNHQEGSYIKVGSLKQQTTPVFTILNLNPFTKYSFKVTAVNSGGESLPSSSYSMITLPSPPEGLAVNTINNSISIVQWDLLKDANSYNIYRLDQYSNVTSQKIIKQNWKSTIFVDWALEKGHFYSYRVTANFLNKTKFNFQNGMWNGKVSTLVEGTYSKWIQASK
jgi:fibronectin type 3 domain-containing protein